MSKSAEKKARRRIRLLEAALLQVIAHQQANANVVDICASALLGKPLPNFTKEKKP